MIESSGFGLRVYGIVTKVLLYGAESAVI